tara:strand:- start:128 stop:394 length:267 start_codon:yes stop_codon:yes gene_type:complete
MTLIISDDYSIEKSFEDKYNLEINDCVVDIIIYCRNNNLPFINKFDYNDFMNVIKKNIDFSKIKIFDIDEEESSDEEIESDDNSIEYN